MFSHRISVRRLRYYEDECRRCRATANDPLTKREFAEFEQKFRQLAMEVEAAQNSAGA
jgi:hypothetical protein